MRSRIFLLLGALSPVMQGCAVYSFAAPDVDTAYAMENKGVSPMDCKYPRKLNGGPRVKGPGDREPITHTFDGANHLIDNYLMVYRCASRHVANGRQHFEVPALALALGGATAAAFGAPSGVAIATGAAGAGLTSTKSYYAPRDKGPILAASVDALTCVKSEASGLDAYAASVIDKAAQNKPEGTEAHEMVSPTAESGGATIAVTAVDQYFTLIETALFSVENIAAQRLGSVGSYAPDALISEITALAAQQKALKDQKQADAGDGGKTVEQKAADEKAGKIIAAAGDAATIDALKTETPEPRKLGDTESALMTTQAFELALKDSTQKKLFSDKLKSGLLGPKTVIAEEKGKLVERPLTSAESTAIAAKSEGQGAREAVSSVLLDITAMQPKLQMCVIRAKL